MAGIPALTYDRDGYGMHTKEDTLDRISPAALEDAMLRIGTLAEELASRNPFPIPRTIPESFQEALQRYFQAKDRYELRTDEQRSDKFL